MVRSVAYILALVWLRWCQVQQQSSWVDPQLTKGKKNSHVKCYNMLSGVPNKIHFSLFFSLLSNIGVIKYN